MRTADRGAAYASQLQLTEPKEQHIAQRGLCVQARKSKLKSLLGPTILLNMFCSSSACSSEVEKKLKGPCLV